MPCDLCDSSAGKLDSVLRRLAHTVGRAERQQLEAFAGNQATGARHISRLSCGYNGLLRGCLRYDFDQVSSSLLQAEDGGAKHERKQEDQDQPIYPPHGADDDIRAYGYIEACAEYSCSCCRSRLLSVWPRRRRDAGSIECLEIGSRNVISSDLRSVRSPPMTPVCFAGVVFLLLSTWTTSACQLT